MCGSAGKKGKGTVPSRGLCVTEENWMSGERVCRGGKRGGGVARKWRDGNIFEMGS